jgi:hypothetical protein
MTAIPAPRAAPHNRGFVASFFDADFRNFVTPTLVTVTWVIWIGVVVIGVVISVIINLLDGEGALVVATPLIGVGVLLIVRMLLEATMVFFSMARDLRTLAERGTNRPGGPHLPA